MSIIGIDLGTTNSLVAVWKDNEAVLIPNEYGDVLTPSVVSVSDEGEILVGKAAKERLISHPESTASIFKRTMGTEIQYNLNGKNFSSEELSALVLKSLKQDAEKFLGEEVTEAIISVPAYFEDAKRQSTKRAGALAGMKVDRIVNEPSAAALACRMEERKKLVANLFFSIFTQEEVEDNKEKDRVYIIFDFGGGTLDVSLVECFDNMVSVVAVSGNNRLGGSDIDFAIADAFCKENHINITDIDPISQRFIMKKAEECKIALTTQKEKTMEIQSPKINGSMFVDYEKLIKICAPILKKTLVPVSKVLVDSERTIEEIDEIILIGGSSKMPIVSRFLKSRLGKKPVTIGSPDTMVALGLGIYAGMKERNEEVKDLIMTDICPFSLGTQVINPADNNKALMSVIIPRNSVLPCSKENQYKPTKLGQFSIHFGFYQGEEYYAKDNTLIGSLDISLPSGYDENYYICLNMTYDLNGILMVEAKDCFGKLMGKDCIVKNINLSDAQIEEAKKALEEVKKETEADAEEKLLLERGKQYFSITTGNIRDRIDVQTRYFEMALKGRSPLKRKEAIERYKSFLESIEQYIETYNVEEVSEEEENWDDLLDDSDD